MGVVLQKLLGGGPIVELDHSFQCCNEEVHSSSSSDSWHTHTPAITFIQRVEKNNVANTKALCQEPSSSVVEQAALESRSDGMDGRS